MKVFQPYSLVINGVTIPFSEVKPDRMLEVLAESGGSSTAPTFGAQKMQKPQLEGKTKAIKTILDAVGVGGLAITGSGSSLVTYYEAKKGDGAPFASGSVHRKYVINKGLVVLKELGARGNDPAEIGFCVYASYDGTHDPIVVSTNQALPSTPAGLEELYVLGPIDDGGSAVEVQDWSFDCGVQVVQKFKDGKPYPEFVGISMYKPMLKFNSLDGAQFDLNGVGTDIIAYLRKLDGDTGHLVADATAEHIALTIPKAMKKGGSGSAGYPNEGTYPVEVTSIYNGTDAVVSVDTTAAIA